MSGHEIDDKNYLIEPIALDSSDILLSKELGEANLVNLGRVVLGITFDPNRATAENNFALFKQSPQTKTNNQPQDQKGETANLTKIRVNHNDVLGFTPVETAIEAIQRQQSKAEIAIKDELVFWENCSFYSDYPGFENFQEANIEFAKSRLAELTVSYQKVIGGLTAPASQEEESPIEIFNKIASGGFSPTGGHPCFQERYLVKPLNLAQPHPNLKRHSLVRESRQGFNQKRETMMIGQIIGHSKEGGTYLAYLADSRLMISPGKFQQPEAPLTEVFSKDIIASLSPQETVSLIEKILKNLKQRLANEADFFKEFFSLNISEETGIKRIDLAIIGYQKIEALVKSKKLALVSQSFEEVIEGVLKVKNC